MSRVYRGLGDLKGLSPKNCAAMPEPAGVLMCRPDFYQVVDVKNPFMAANVGQVDKDLARRQWEELKAAFETAGKTVSLIEPVAGLEDMVFCANQVLTGLTSRGEKVFVSAQMRHSSRRREVPHFEAWLKARGYEARRLKDAHVSFEGGGDALWHPGKRLLWGGHGFRTEPQAYDEVSDALDTPVVLLKLVNERFYHLDTCFCPLTSEAVLIYPSAFSADSLELILKMFPIVLTCGEHDAARLMACNAAVVGKAAIIQKGASAVVRHMQVMGLSPVEIDTSEFIKSGGSVYCLKNWLY